MSVRELLDAREAIIKAWKGFHAAEKVLDDAFSLIKGRDASFAFDPDHEIKGDDWRDERRVTILDYSLWSFAFEKLNLTKAMTEAKRAEFLQEVRKNGTAFSEKNILGLAQNAAKIFQDSSLHTVREVYRKLIGAEYEGYVKGDAKRKRDNLRKVEACFRLRWSDVCISSYGNRIDLRYDSYNNSTTFRFNDLLTACRLIEGKGFTDYSNDMRAFLNQVPRGQTWVDTGYFVITAYKNGNKKVNWNEDKLDVLDRLNAIGSGREADLPDTMRKRYKAEHFHDGGMPKAEEYFQPDPKMEPSDDKDFAFYPTPPEVAARMMELAEYLEEHPMDTLEPSAGDGALLGSIPWDFGCQAVEFNHHRALKLKSIYPMWTVTEADFLRWTHDQLFDRVLMNPPFNDRIEAIHVIKAWSHLKPGGLLVAIIPEGWFFRDDTKSQVFRAFLQKYEHRPSEKLAAGTFGRTRVETRIVVLRKPEY
jgi:hypothetical protein